jgi:glycosyltransferase involved in cell wall biosynthesis
MSEPLVCAVMLVNGREAMVRRAIQSFCEQSYLHKALLLYDSGSPALPPHANLKTHESWLHVSHVLATGGKTIGRLRNEAIELALQNKRKADIFVTFDSDDWSHPQRIAEQVALLRSSGADCVGYRECAFWDSRQINRFGQPMTEAERTAYDPQHHGSAWIYDSRASNRIVGASMMYTRAAYERNKFRDINTGEDYHFAMRCNVVGVSGISHDFVNADDPERRWCRVCGTDSVDPENPHCEPRLICGIHGSNTADYSRLSRQTWRREPSLDQICAERMKL